MCNAWWVTVTQKTSRSPPHPPWRDNWGAPLWFIISEITPRSHNRDPQYYRMSKEKNLIQKNLQQILVFCMCSHSPDPQSPCWGLKCATCTSDEISNWARWTTCMLLCCSCETHVHKMLKEIWGIGHRDSVLTSEINMLPTVLKRGLVGSSR
jgi:hypothetical protein